MAAVNDYELIVQGLAGMLADFPDRVRVRDRFVIGEPVENGPIDVALFDTYGRVGIAENALRTLTRHPEIGRVALFSLDFPPTLVADAHRFGVRAFISKTLPGRDVADALLDVADGKTVEAIGPRRLRSDPRRTWPGRDDGLTERESQVLVLCAEGLTNKEIAKALYVNVETVKSHLKRIYRRLEIHNRSQATRYAHRTGAFTKYQPADSADAPQGTIDDEPVERRRRG